MPGIRGVQGSQVREGTFGARLRERRRVLGISQEGIGDTIGRTGASVSHWELGVYEPSMVDLQMLATGLGCTLDWLVCGDRGSVVLLGADAAAGGPEIETERELAGIV